MNAMPHHDQKHMADQHLSPGATPSASMHDHHAVAMFRDKFWLSFALTIPVVFLSGDVGTNKDLYVLSGKENGPWHSTNIIRAFSKFSHPRRSTK
jgi:hypothetical protein